MNNFFYENKLFLIFYVLEWSVFGVMSTPDKDKVEECDKCTRLAIHVTMRHFLLTEFAIS